MKYITHVNELNGFISILVSTDKTFGDNYLLTTTDILSNLNIPIQKENNETFIDLTNSELKQLIKLSQ